MTMTCKINKLEKPGGPQGNFHALFGRSAAVYGHFQVDAVTSEWSTRISISNAARGIFKKNLICEISHFTTFPRILVFASQKRLANLTSTKIPHGIITKTKFIYLKTYRRKIARRAIISEICILQNFAFYNIWQNLGF